MHAHMMHACKRCTDLQDACVSIRYTLIRCTSMRYTSMRYPSVAGVHLIILGRQVTDRHTTVLGGMLSCVMVPPNGSASTMGFSISSLGCRLPKSASKEKPPRVTLFKVPRVSNLFIFRQTNARFPKQSTA